MNGAPQIIAIDSSSQRPVDDEFVLTQQIVDVAEDEPQWVDDPGESPARLAWLSPLLACLAVLIWTGLFVWANAASLQSPLLPRDITSLFGDWAVPVLLIGVVWLLAMRTSRKEAARFGDAARLLASESAQLEARLTTVNRELSLARDFVAAQARDLDALGRIATDRLTQSADRMQSVIAESSTRIDSIGTVSESALDNMEKLRSHLPVISNAAKDVTSNIANSGRVANAQLQEMITGFKRLNEFGQASERQVISVRDRVQDSLTDFTRHKEALDQASVAGFATLSEQSAELASQLAAREDEAFAAMRARAAELAGELEQSRTTLDTSEAESITSLRARLSAIRDEGTAMARSMREAESRAVKTWQTQLGTLQEDLRQALSALEEADGKASEAAVLRASTLAGEIARIEDTLVQAASRADSALAERRASVQTEDEAALAQFSDRLAQLDDAIAGRRGLFEQQTAALAAHGENLVARLEQFSTAMARTADDGAVISTRVSDGLAALSTKLSESVATLADTGRQIDTLTDGSIRLLELIQASAAHSQEQLPAALAVSEGALATIEARVAALHDTVEETAQRGSSLTGHVEATSGEVRALFSEFDSIQMRIGETSQAHASRLTELAALLTAIEQQSDAIAGKTGGELAVAIDSLTVSARDALNALEGQSAETLSRLASEMATKSAAAVESAMREATADSLGSLEAAVATAGTVSRDTMIQLRDQLARVNELAGNLETRVAHARQRAEEQVDGDFARRVALITEALNSHAIDIARAIDSDVSDTAWSSYLKGDRGIFTRRAVTLLETGEARSIAQLYEADTEFREHVRRYIHDFEAMLRQLLSTRDGHALGVTVLSADMGKLYVALAQAIERLRS